MSSLLREAITATERGAGLVGASVRQDQAADPPAAPQVDVGRCDVGRFSRSSPSSSSAKISGSHDSGGHIAQGRDSRKRSSTDFRRAFGNSTKECSSGAISATVNDQCIRKHFGSDGVWTFTGPRGSQATLEASAMEPCCDVGLAGATIGSSTHLSSPSFNTSTPSDDMCGLHTAPKKWAKGSHMPKSRLSSVHSPTHGIARSLRRSCRRVSVATHREHPHCLGSTSCSSSGSSSKGSGSSTLCLAPSKLTRESIGSGSMTDRYSVAGQSVHRQGGDLSDASLLSTTSMSRKRVPAPHSEIIRGGATCTAVSVALVAAPGTLLPSPTHGQGDRFYPEDHFPIHLEGDTIRLPTSSPEVHTPSLTAKGLGSHHDHIITSSGGDRGSSGGRHEPSGLPSVGRAAGCSCASFEHGPHVTSSVDAAISGSMTRCSLTRRPLAPLSSSPFLSFAGGHTATTTAAAASDSRSAMDAAHVIDLPAAVNPRVSVAGVRSAGMLRFDSATVKAPALCSAVAASHSTVPQRLVPLASTLSATACAAATVSGVKAATGNTVGVSESLPTKISAFVPILSGKNSSCARRLSAFSVAASVSDDDDAAAASSSSTSVAAVDLQAGPVPSDATSVTSEAAVSLGMTMSPATALRVALLPHSLPISCISPSDFTSSVSPDTLPRRYGCCALHHGQCQSPELVADATSVPSVSGPSPPRPLLATLNSPLRGAYRPPKRLPQPPCRPLEAVKEEDEEERRIAAIAAAAPTASGVHFDDDAPPMPRSMHSTLSTALCPLFLLGTSSRCGRSARSLSSAVYAKASLTGVTRDRHAGPLASVSSRTSDVVSLSNIFHRVHNAGGIGSSEGSSIRDSTGWEISVSTRRSSGIMGLYLPTNSNTTDSDIGGSGGAPHNALPMLTALHGVGAGPSGDACVEVVSHRELVPSELRPISPMGDRGHHRGMRDDEAVLCDNASRSNSRLSLDCQVFPHLTPLPSPTWTAAKRAVALPDTSGRQELLMLLSKTPSRLSVTAEAAVDCGGGEEGAALVAVCAGRQSSESVGVGMTLSTPSSLIGKLREVIATRPSSGCLPTCAPTLSCGSWPTSPLENARRGPLQQEHTVSFSTALSDTFPVSARDTPALSHSEVSAVLTTGRTGATSTASPSSTAEAPLGVSTPTRPPCSKSEGSASGSGDNPPNASHPTSLSDSSVMRSAADTCFCPTVRHFVSTAREGCTTPLASGSATNLAYTVVPAGLPVACAPTHDIFTFCGALCSRFPASSAAPCLMEGSTIVASADRCVTDDDGAAIPAVMGQGLLLAKSNTASPSPLRSSLPGGGDGVDVSGAPLLQRVSASALSRQPTTRMTAGVLYRHGGVAGAGAAPLLPFSNPDGSSADADAAAWPSLSTGTAQDAPVCAPKSLQQDEIPQSMQQCSRGAILRLLGCPDSLGSTVPRTEAPMTPHPAILHNPTAEFSIDVAGVMNDSTATNGAVRSHELTSNMRGSLSSGHGGSTASGSVVRNDSAGQPVLAPASTIPFAIGGSQPMPASSHSRINDISMMLAPRRSVDSDHDSATSLPASKTSAPSRVARLADRLPSTSGDVKLSIISFSATDACLVDSTTGGSAVAAQQPSVGTAAVVPSAAASGMVEMRFFGDASAMSSSRSRSASAKHRTPTREEAPREFFMHVSSAKDQHHLGEPLCLPHPICPVSNTPARVTRTSSGPYLFSASSLLHAPPSTGVGQSSTSADMGRTVGSSNGTSAVVSLDAAILKEASPASLESARLVAVTACPEERKQQGQTMGSTLCSSPSAAIMGRSGVAGITTVDRDFSTTGGCHVESICTLTEALHRVAAAGSKPSVEHRNRNTGPLPPKSKLSTVAGCTQSYCNAPLSSCEAVMSATVGTQLGRRPSEFCVSSSSSGSRRTPDTALLVAAASTVAQDLREHRFPSSVRDLSVFPHRGGQQLAVGRTDLISPTASASPRSGSAPSTLPASLPGYTEPTSIEWCVGASTLTPNERRIFYDKGAHVCGGTSLNILLAASARFDSAAPAPEEGILYDSAVSLHSAPRGTQVATEGGARDVLGQSGKLPSSGGVADSEKDGRDADTLLWFHHMQDCHMRGVGCTRRIPASCETTEMMLVEPLYAGQGRQAYNIFQDDAGVGTAGGGVAKPLLFPLAPLAPTESPWPGLVSRRNRWSGSAIHRGVVAHATPAALLFHSVLNADGNAEKNDRERVPVKAQSNLLRGALGSDKGFCTGTNNGGPGAFGKQPASSIITVPVLSAASATPACFHTAGATDSGTYSTNLPTTNTLSYSSSAFVAPRLAPRPLYKSDGSAPLSTFRVAPLAQRTFVSALASTTSPRADRAAGERASLAFPLPAVLADTVDTDTTSLPPPVRSAVQRSSRTLCAINSSSPPRLIASTPPLSSPGGGTRCCSNFSDSASLALRSPFGMFQRIPLSAETAGRAPSIASASHLSEKGSERWSPTRDRDCDPRDGGRDHQRLDASTCNPQQDDLGGLAAALAVSPTRPQHVALKFASAGHESPCCYSSDAAPIALVGATQNNGSATATLGAIPADVLRKRLGPQASCIAPAVWAEAAGISALRSVGNHDSGVDVPPPLRSAACTSFFRRFEDACTEEVGRDEAALPGALPNTPVAASTRVIPHPTWCSAPLAGLNDRPRAESRDTCNPPTPDRERTTTPLSLSGSVPLLFGCERVTRESRSNISDSDLELHPIFSEEPKKIDADMFAFTVTRRRAAELSSLCFPFSSSKKLTVSGHSNSDEDATGRVSGTTLTASWTDADVMGGGSNSGSLICAASQMASTVAAGATYLLPVLSCGVAPALSHLSSSLFAGSQHQKDSRGSSILGIALAKSETASSLRSSPLLHSGTKAPPSFAVCGGDSSECISGHEQRQEKFIVPLATPSDSPAPFSQHPFHGSAVTRTASYNGEYFTATEAVPGVASTVLCVSHDRARVTHTISSSASGSGSLDASLSTCNTQISSTEAVQPSVNLPLPLYPFTADLLASPSPCAGPRLCAGGEGCGVGGGPRRGGSFELASSTFASLLYIPPELRRGSHWRHLKQRLGGTRTTPSCCPLGIMRHNSGLPGTASENSPHQTRPAAACSSLTPPSSATLASALAVGTGAKTPTCASSSRLLGERCTAPTATEGRPCVGVGVVSDVVQGRQLSQPVSMNRRYRTLSYQILGMRLPSEDVGESSLVSAINSATVTTGVSEWPSGNITGGSAVTSSSSSTHGGDNLLPTPAAGAAPIGLRQLIGNDKRSCLLGFLDTPSASDANVGTHRRSAELMREGVALGAHPPSVPRIRGAVVHHVSKTIEHTNAWSTAACSCSLPQVLPLALQESEDDGLWCDCVPKLRKSGNDIAGGCRPTSSGGGGNEEVPRGDDVVVKTYEASLGVLSLSSVELTAVGPAEVPRGLSI